MDLTLTDGRTLAWAQHGDDTGRPVVFLHGTPGSRLYRPADEALDGVRLITLDRPGYGRSDPAPRPSLLGVADAIGQLTTFLGIGRFGVVGFSGGAPYALACGVRLSHRLTGVVAAGLTGPDRELGTLRGRERIQVEALRAFPFLGRRYVVQAAQWYADDPLRNHRRILASGTDRWMVPGEDNNREGARQGSVGLVGDFLATDIHPWGFRLRDVRVRVRVWAGRGDPGRAVPDAAPVAARLPNAEVVLADDADHTPSADHWRQMLTWVTAA